MRSGLPIPGDVTFPSGEERPALGLGTWRFGEQAARAAAEVGALRLALDMGYRVIDTAEMYGDGGPDGHPNSPTSGHLKFPHLDRASMRR